MSTIPQQQKLDPIEVERLALRIQAEVLEDMRKGTIPTDVRTFSRLHDFTDANMYGEDIWNGLIGEDGNLDLATEYLNAAQGRVEEWLQSRPQPATRNLTNDPTSAFIGHHKSALQLVWQIKDRLEDHLDYDPDNIHWGHVGTIRAIVDGLREVYEKCGDGVLRLAESAPVAFGALSADDACQGCGRVDPCGAHYSDCTLLEPGDKLIERSTEREIGTYDGPDLSGLHTEEDSTCDLCNHDLGIHTPTCIECGCVNQSDRPV